MPAVYAVAPPPPIPDGPVTYSSVSYDAPAATDIPAPDAATAPALPAAGPITAASSEQRGYVELNAYTSNYQVRGMGVTNSYSDHGWSSIRGSYTLRNRNLFNRGIYQRIGGELGIIWDAANYLGDTPMWNLHYGLGKELFPNLKAELGYTMHRGGLEGGLAKWQGHVPHRFTQDLNFTLTFNDHQRGFFGHALMGVGIYGLTGTFFDFEAGYRLTDILSRGNYGFDLEVSGGIAPSLGYWGGHVEGIDAYRIKAAVAPYSKLGKFGRDAKLYIKPWIQFSWAGSNKSKIRRAMHSGAIDDFQTTVGVEGGFTF
ncbi:MAG: hypothetical protein Q4C88_02060 [Akkermansia sp.]|nr:hypothetical protein [Akkermansia sp.]